MRIVADEVGADDMAHDQLRLGRRRSRRLEQSLADLDQTFRGDFRHDPPPAIPQPYGRCEQGRIVSRAAGLGHALCEAAVCDVGGSPRAVWSGAAGQGTPRTGAEVSG